MPKNQMDTLRAFDSCHTAEYGKVYCLSNPHFPGIYKIGRTHRPIDIRVSELNKKPYGFPDWSYKKCSHWSCCFYITTNDYKHTEEKMHKLFRKYHIPCHRDEPRELFTDISLDDIEDAFKREPSSTNFVYYSENNVQSSSRLTMKPTITKDASRQLKTEQQRQRSKREREQRQRSRRQRMNQKDLTIAEKKQEQQETAVLEIVRGDKGLDLTKWVETTARLLGLSLEPHSVAQQRMEQKRAKLALTYLLRSVKVVKPSDSELEELAAQLDIAFQKARTRAKKGYKKPKRRKEEGESYDEEYGY